MNPITVAWLLLSLTLFLYAGRVLIADLRGPTRGRSWGECCLDARDGLRCDCWRAA